MKSKHDMYIDYNRSYKRRGKKNNHRILKILIIILLVLGLGTSAFYVVKAQLKQRAEQTKDIDQANSNQETEDNNTPQNGENTQPTVIPTITAQPTPSPTAQPTPTTSAGGDELPVNSTNTSSVMVKGIYVTAPTAGTSNMQHLVDLVETTELNAMVIDIKDDHGKISYKMDSAMANEIGAVTNTVPDMEEFVKSLKEKNIYLIARIVAFKDPLLAEERQDLAVKNQDGTLYRDNNGEGWVNPYQTEVWDYLVEVATQAAAIGFDEIQFDYIRFSTGKGMSEADFGEEALTKNKEEIITEFTKYAYEKIKPLGVFVSADVYGTIISSTIDAGLVGQDYVEMSKYLDYICPMIYPSHFGEGNYGIEHPDLEPYNIIRKVLTASQEKLDQIPEGQHRAIVRPWLQDFTATWIKYHMEYGGEELREQIKGVYSVNYAEWLLWNASCKYSEDGLLTQ